MLAPSLIAHSGRRIDPASSVAPAGVEAPVSALLETCARAGYGVVILDPLGAVAAMNAPAAAALATLAGHADGDPAQGELASDAVKALLARGVRLPGPGADAWTWVARAGGRPLLLHAIPMPRADAARGDTALVLIDLDRPPPPSRVAMEQVFGLTPAEARLTALLTGGASPSEAAAAQGGEPRHGAQAPGGDLREDPYARAGRAGRTGVAAGRTALSARAGLRTRSLQLQVARMLARRAVFASPMLLKF